MDNKTFVPFGIPAFGGEKENAGINFVYEVKNEEAKKIILQIRERNKEIYKKELIAPEGKPFAKKKYSWQWDGFDNNGILDTSKLVGKKLNFYITALSVSNKVTHSCLDFELSYSKVNWVDVRIDRPNKIIQATVRINLRDGGAVGIKPYNEIVFEGTFGEKVITLKEERPWEAIPKNTLNVYRHPIIRKQLLSFEKLRDLALQGVERYWSRQSSNQEGKNVKIGDDLYQVIVRAIPHKEGMVAPKIIFFTNKKEDNSNRSHNWFASRELYYEVGYIQKSNGIWEYIEEKEAIEEFQETAAHEIGHKLLEDYGGMKYSYKHKGTSTLLQDPIKNTPYPQKGEIDLMKYSDDKYKPFDYRDRVILSEKDLKGLLWLTKMNIIL